MKPKHHNNFRQRQRKFENGELNVLLKMFKGFITREQRMKYWKFGRERYMMPYSLIKKQRNKIKQL